MLERFQPLLSQLLLYACIGSSVGLLLKRVPWLVLEPSHRTKVVITAVAFLSIFLSYVLIQFHLYHTFQIPAFDGAIYLHRMWQFAKFDIQPDHFFPFPSHPLRDHFEPILFIVGQVFRIFEDARMALIVDSAILAVGFIPMLGLSQVVLGSFWCALGIATAYSFSIGVISALLYPFHPAAWLTTFYIFALYASTKGAWRLYFFWIVLALLSRESAGAHVVGIGILMIFWRKRPAIGLATIVLGLAYMALVLSIVMPSFNQNKIPPHMAEFRTLGGSFAEMLTYIALNPLKSLGLLVDTPAKVTMLVYTLATTGFLLAVNPLFLVALLPFFFERLIPNKPGGLVSLDYHYSAPIMSLLFVGSILSLSYLAKIFHVSRAVLVGGTVYLCLSSTYVLLNPIHDISPMARVLSGWPIETPLIEESLHDTLAFLPSEKSVLVPRPLAARVSFRNAIYIYGVGNWRRADYILLPKNAEITALDPEDRDEDSLLARHYLASLPNYSRTVSNNHFELFQKDGDLNHDSFEIKRFIKKNNVDLPFRLPQTYPANYFSGWKNPPVITRNQ